MARNLDQNVIDMLSAYKMFPFFCLDFTDGDTNYKYTTLDVPITLSVSGGPSGVYESRGFEFESINYTLSNVMDNATIRIDNLDSVLTSIFVGGTVEEKEASLYLGLMNTATDSTSELLGTALVFTGEVDSFELDETEVRMVIGSIFSRWSHQSFGKHSSSCRYKVFKGNKCGYIDSHINCDRSYTRCFALDNTVNFGGFKWLPSIENKKIWWGPTPSERQAENNVMTP